MSGYWKCGRFSADKAVDKYRTVYPEVVHRGQATANVTETSHAK